jgi:hypothetical protein
MEQEVGTCSARCVLEILLLCSEQAPSGSMNGLQKGGDPAAPSDTATLLRLRANHRHYLRQLLPCG